MLKRSVSLLLIFAVVFLTCSTVLAQTTVQLNEKPAAKSDLKQFFALETQRSSTLPVNFENIEKDAIKRQVKKTSLWEKPKTWIWVAVAAGAAVTILVLATRDKGRDELVTGGIQIPDCRVTAC